MTEEKLEKKKRFKNKEKRQQAHAENKEKLSALVSSLASKAQVIKKEQDLTNKEQAPTPKKSRYKKPKVDARIIELSRQKQEEKAQEALERQAQGEKNNNFEKYFLDQRLLGNLYQQNFVKATDIQDKAINAALDGHDILASAQTGTGKTLAYLIPAIQYMLDFPTKAPNCRVLIIAPTRDLVLQIQQQALNIIKGLGINVGYLFGKLADSGENYNQYETEDAFFNNQIMITTPGRLANELTNGLDISFVEYLILDEADRTLEIGLGQDIKTIVEHTPNREHTMFLSATIDNDVKELFYKSANKNPLEIEASHSRAEKNKLTQYYYHADSVEHKIQLLANIIKENNWQKVMIFVKKKETVTKVYKALSNMRIGIRATQIDGDMDQEARSRALGLFTSGKVQVIVTTDLLARGIDIDNVKAVINFDLPFDGDSFVHRVGRTGRMGQKGIAVSLVEAHDYYLLGKAMRYMREEIPAKIFPGLEPKTSAPANAFTPKSNHKVKNKTTNSSKKSKKVKIKNRKEKQKNKGFPKRLLKS